MPYRALNGLLVVAGLVLALFLIVLGADLALAARSGPRWKRHLVAAGLGLLASLGLLPTGCQSAESENPAPSTAAPAPGQSLAETPQWKHLTATWAEAEEVGSGKRGPYPFDAAGKKKLLADLATVGTDIDTLAKAGQLNDAEAGLLREDLKRLVASVQEKRPTEMSMATCYDLMPMQPAHDSLSRLQARLPLLEKLAADEKIHLDAVRKVLATIEADIAYLEAEEHLKEFAPTERPEAAKTRDAARTAVERVKAHLAAPPATPAAPAPGQSLAETPQWKHLTATWAEAEEVASGRRGDYPFDEAGKKKLLADLATVGTDIDDLAKASLLNETEAGLLREDLKHLVAGVQEKRPTEMSMATCYNLLMMRPAHDSLSRLQARLPLLEKLADDEKIHPDAVRKVLATIEADIACLEAEEHLKEFAPTERPEAEKTRDAARTAVERVRARMNPPIDSKILCYYYMMLISPQQERLERLSARLPMLKKMAAQGKLRPAVIEKTLPPIEADLKQLSSPPENYKAKMREEFDKQAAAVRAEAEQALADLKKSTGAKG